MSTHIVVLQAQRPTFFASPDRVVPRANYVEVARISVQADGDAALDEAYARTQNLDAAWRPSSPCRSTSVGDVLVLETDASTQAFEVASLGFNPITLS